MLAATFGVVFGLGAQILRPDAPVAAVAAEPAAEPARAPGHDRDVLEAQLLGDEARALTPTALHLDEQARTRWLLVAADLSEAAKGAPNPSVRAEHRRTLARLEELGILRRGATR